MNGTLVGLPRRKALPADGGPRRVVLVGNPNTGKTSLFNRLAGTRHRVGNYPGVTVERTEAELTLPSGRTVTLVDLPGTYSLSARSEEERIALRQLTGDAGDPLPDLVVLVLDTTQLERNLYLAVQLRELPLPALFALNFNDEARAQGIEVDVAQLSAAFHVAVRPVSARSGEGFPELIDAIDAALAHARPHTALPIPTDAVLGPVLDDLEPLVPAGPLTERPGARRALAAWWLLSADGTDELEAAPPAMRLALSRHHSAHGDALESRLIEGRYAFVDSLIGRCVRRSPSGRARPGDRVDAILLHPVLGLLIFLGLMTALFQGLFTWSEPAIAAVEAVFASIGDGARQVLPEGWVADFVAEAVVGGVGSVLVFLPQIILLFAAVGIMEDSGYMARVAYLMDRVMRSVGLHGRAFVPMLSGFACAVPAILATRTMERQRDRLLTMLVVPLMSCSARLPVYTLVLGALFAETTILGIPAQGMLMAALYLLSTILALVVAAVLGRTVVRGERVPLILELPPYRLPSLRTVLQQVVDRSRTFVTEAGTVILACTAVLWVLLHVPHVSAPADASPEEAQRLQIEGSLAGSLGKGIEPLIAPLGFDWKIGVGLIGAFAAREVFVATLGVVYGAGADVDEGSDTLRERIAAERRPDGSPVYDARTGLSLLAFFALSAQCLSTLAAVRRETGGWMWPSVLFVYMTVLAWVVAFICYRLGGALLPT